MYRMMILSTALASLSACSAGDFCQVVKAPLEFEPATAAIVVQTDRPDAERIKVQNTYGKKHCNW